MSAKHDVVEAEHRIDNPLPSVTISVEAQRGGSRTHKVVIRVLHLLKQATSVGVQLFCAWIISSYSPSHETSVEERAERLLGSAYWNVSLYRKDFE